MSGYSRPWAEAGLNAPAGTVVLHRAVVGLTGEFGESTWSWDAYYAYGKSETLQAVYDSPHSDRFLMAIDAVDDGAGNPICRVTRDAS